MNSNVRKISAILLLIGALGFIVNGIINIIKGNGFDASTFGLGCALVGASAIFLVKEKK